MPKILFLHRYDRQAAAFRYRYEQFLPWIRETDFKIESQSLFDQDYLKRKYETGGTPLIKTAGLYLKRLQTLLSARQYDLVFIFKDLLPYVPFGFERLLLGSKTPYIVDLDDAIFRQYQNSGNPIVRSILGSKYDKVFKGAKAVVAGNKYLFDYASQFNSNVKIIPTVVDMRSYKMKTYPKNDRQPLLGWLGSPGSSRYLEVARRPIERFVNKGGRVVIIGSRKVDLEGIHLERRDWREDTEISDIQSFDLGMMPLGDDDFAKGKCGFKLIQYMACGVPSVASPVGVNSEIIQPENGFLAGSEDEWDRVLDWLLNASRDDLQKKGAHARQFIEDRYSLQKYGPVLRDFLIETVG